MQNVIRISRRDEEDLKTIQNAIVSQENIVSHSSAIQSASELKVAPSSGEFMQYHARRQMALLEREQTRLSCKLRASEEALRRATLAEIPSSQCQSEFAMLFAQTDAGSRGVGDYVRIQNDTECPFCSIPAEIVESYGEIICPKCGWNTEYMECTMNSLALGESRDFRAGSYKRINHFLDYLQHLQAKEETTPPAELIQGLKAHIIETLNLDRKTPPRYVIDRIVDFVKAKKFPRRFAVRAVQLYHYVFDSSSVKLLHSDIRNLKSKFKMLLALYYKFVPTSRKNFLSYPFCAYCLIRLIHPEHVLLEFVQMLKNLPKLQPQAEIVKRIFQHLGWEFPPIPWTHIRQTRDLQSIKTSRT